jgi:glycine cleavage system H lipoate-binding protein/ABC-type phosphate transport system substrate-binding protein
MKAIISLPAMMVCIFWWVAVSPLQAVNEDAVKQDQVSPGQAVTIACSPEVYGLVNTLAKEYGKTGPGGKINVVMREKLELAGNQPLYITSGEDFGKTDNAGLWKIVIARDAVVPVMNAANPLTERISREGLTPSAFATLLKNPAGEMWESVLPGGAKVPVRIFLPADDQVRTQIAGFAQMDPAVVRGTVLASSAAIINVVQKDTYSMGFCRMSDLVDPATGDFYGKIRLVPIDKNQNGRIDSFEDIYAGKDAFIRGVWIGKYPKSLCGNVYAIAPAAPAGKNELAFLGWVISMGQQVVQASGYSELSSVLKQNALESLNPPVKAPVIAAPGRPSYAWILVLVTLVIAGLMFLPVFLVRRKKPAVVADSFQISPVLNNAAVSAPAGIFYGKTHTWAFMEKDGLVKMGVDDFMQHVTGSLTSVVMKSPGEKIRKGEKALTVIRDGKQLSLYAPVTGTIRESNRQLLADSSLVNSSPYTDGWVYRIEPKNWLKDIQYLFMIEQYREFLKDEFARLKDFFAVSVRKNAMVYSHVILQDGGEIMDHVLADLGPDIWEEFQMEFINAEK